ncbi:MAG: MFS transporter, partial [Clostridia bacterium]|nr:MFS transporter [Clostridia bacterium]
MKLNTKRTILVGFAFFLISAFWQAYDAIIPLMLTNKFGLDQTWSGLIMSLDNILALFMLPIFGALSDKTNTKYGKRKPFVVIGAILAVVCFVGLSFVDAAQLQKIKDENVTNATYWEQRAEYQLSNREYHSITNANVDEKYDLDDYASLVRYNKRYDSLTDAEKAELQTWYEGLDYDAVYSFDTETDTYTIYANKDAVPEGVRTTSTYSTLISGAESLFAKEVTKGNVFVLVIFIIILLMTLISMATFRSPAVALMPDVTVKPLRSKANAIINLMGTAGGILVLLLGMVFGTGKVQNQLMDYRWFVATVCGIMLIALTVFILTVKEKKWNQEMLDEQAKLDAEEQNNQPQQPTEAPVVSDKLPKDKLISLIFILASVAMWFTGYNAVTSKYSVYAVNVLNKDYNTTLLIAQAAAVVAYIPVGIVASKLGRKKTILIGVGMLFTAFFGATFITASSPDFVITLLFALAGIAWATINVNSFPMVVELAQGSTIGKYTGYYYTASMAAQVITPILSGFLMDTFGTMSILFPYASIFVAIAFVTMCFVKHGDAKPEQPKDKLS